MRTESGAISVLDAISRIGFARTLDNKALLLAAIFGLSVLSGCGTFQAAQLPPVPSKPDAVPSAGKFVWIDLLTEDTGVASVFYEALFGWRTAPAKGDKSYYVFSLDGERVAGMTTVDNKNNEIVESWWLLSLSVDDVDQSVEVVKEYGGTLLAGPVDDAGRGRMALVSDAGGAPLILLRAPGGDPTVDEAAIGTWFWSDLFTHDANAAEAFYNPLAGFEKKRLDAGQGQRNLVFERNGKPRAGLVELQWEDLQDNWLPYINVEDVRTTVDKARELGGNLILEKGDVAILVDPTGAVFGVQTQR